MDHLYKKNIEISSEKLRENISLPFGQVSPVPVSKPWGGASAIRIAILTAFVRHDKVWAAACNAGAIASGKSPPKYNFSSKRYYDKK